MYRYEFTRFVFNCRWTIVVDQDGITFSRGQVFSWMSGMMLDDGWSFYFQCGDRGTSRVRKLRWCARQLACGRRGNFRFAMLRM